MNHKIQVLSICQKSKKALAALFLTAVVLSLLTACGRDNDSGDSGSAAVADGSNPNPATPDPNNSCPANPSQATDLNAVLAEQRKPYKRFIVKARHTDEAAISTASTTIKNSFAGAAKVEALDAESFTVEFSEELTGEQVENFMSSSDYEYVEPDYVVHHTAITNDPRIAQQWAHQMVKSAEAWQISKGSASVIVGVIDTGIDYSHGDLAANMWSNPGELASNGIDDDGNGYTDDTRGWNFVSNNNSVRANDNSTYHGTHVAGTVGAVGNNSLGISGHAQSVKLMALKFLDSSGAGYTSNAVKAVDYAIANGAKIVSNSWGGSSYSQSLSAAIDRARKAGVLFVAAAGNAGRNNDSSNFYPANYTQDNVISVAASTSSDKLASFSNYGANRVDLAAPGSSIYSTKNGNSYQSLSGTSMAAPLVSGVLATMVALRPDLTYSHIKAALMSNVDVLSSMSGKVLSGGRINAYKALNAIRAATNSDPIPAPSCP